MILISYDIQDDKLRTKFSKYIKRFGHRLQYSVYEIDNSERILDNIIADINNRFMDEFSEADSVLIMKLSKTCDIIRLGYAKHEESEIVMV
ncbi:MAG: CRISPR-associated endonuclease Cas2 [Methanomassiliicoccaceae archaeon]|nr:CRISPR-associated endonuclease Cas2 [Methanomassiliicoccaceae archaeon]